MGLFGSSSFQRDNSREVLEEEAKLVRKNISDLRSGTPMEKLADLRQKEKVERLKKSAIGRSVQGSRAVGFETGRAAAIGMQQQVNFSREQEMLSGMFMGGDGTFWNLPDSDTNVRIHNDLNPSKRGDYGTAGIFGFGNGGEKSGLF